MASSNVSDVIASAQALLGDPNGDQFTSVILTPFFNNAWNDLLRCMRKLGLPDIERDLFVKVSAYTNRLSPSVYVSDFAVPIQLFERGNPTSVSISSTTNAAPIAVTTATAHGRATNDEVELQGVSGVIDGPWEITVTGANSFTLNGSAAPGATYSAGTVIYSTERFVPMGLVTEINPTPSGDLPPTLGIWEYENKIIWFRGCTTDREVKVRYTSSGAAPASGALGIDDAADVLAHATAMYAGSIQDMQSLVTRERIIAYGPTGQPDNKGGLIRDLLQPLLIQKQWTPRRPQPFRPRRVDPAKTGMF